MPPRTVLHLSLSLRAADFSLSLTDHAPGFAATGTADLKPDPHQAAGASLAGFASVISARYLNEYVDYQMAAARTVELPMMEHMRHLSAEALRAASMAGTRELLTHLAEGRGDDYIQTTLLRWQADALDLVGRRHIAIADITGLNLIRKQTFLHLLPRYTPSLAEATTVIAEIDGFIYRQETAALAQLNRIAEETTRSQEHFIERIASTVPGTLYVYNVAEQRTEFATPYLEKISGYTPEDVTRLGPALRPRLIHPDDLEEASGHLAGLATLEEGEIRSHRYRLQHKDGHTVWIRSYDAAFRRNAEGAVTHSVGFSFDVTAEKAASEALRERERQLLEAQEIGQIGSYVIDIPTNTSRGTPKLHALLELHDINDWPAYESRIHPDDRSLVQQRLEEAYQRTGIYQCTYRYQTSRGERYLACNGKVEYSTAGPPLTMSGTVQDVTETEELLRRLRQSETRYRLGESVARLGVFVWEVGTDKTRWSAELFRLYGLEGEDDDLVDRAAMREYADPADREAILEEMRRAMATRTPFTLTYGITTAAGERKRLYSRAEFVSDDTSTGKLRLVGTVQDVTEREALLERLQESKARYKEAQAIAHIGNWSVDLGTGKVEWSLELYRIFGLDPQSEPLTVDVFAQRVHATDRDGLLDIFGRMTKESGTYEYAYRLYGPDGTALRWMHMRAESHLAPGGGRLRGTVQDVTAQKEVEARLEEQEGFIRNVTQLVPSIIAVADLQTGKYVFVNAIAETITGVPAHRFIEEGIPLLVSLVHPDDLPLLENATTELPALSRAAGDGAGEEPVHAVQYRLRTADGSYRWMRSLTTPFRRDAEGAVLQTISITQDVTPLQDAEDLLKAKNDLLQQSNANLQEFAYVASHDLQEPLRKISTFGTMLRSHAGDRLDDRGSVYLQKIIDSAGRLQGMISDLLDFSRISGQKGFERTPLGPLLAAATAALEHRMEGCGARVESSELPSATVVPSQIQQVFQNLLGNSLKFTRTGVPPVIRVSYRGLSGEEAVTQYGLKGSAAYVELQLADNGIGFDNQYAGKIFTIFQRLHGRAEYEGSGIGLSICKKIIEHAGGCISATGKEGEGATFTIVLPA